MANILDNIETMVAELKAVDKEGKYKEKCDYYTSKIQEIKDKLSASGNNILTIISQVSDLEVDFYKYVTGIEDEIKLTTDLSTGESNILKLIKQSRLENEKKPEPEVTEKSLALTNTIRQPQKVKLDCNIYKQTFFTKREVLRHKKITVVLDSDGRLSIPYEYRGNLASITIPEGVRQIADSGFCGCMRLRGITIPKGITKIGKGAFVNCNLEEVLFEEDSKLQEIGESAFLNPTFPTITLPASVIEIGDNAFSDLDQGTLKEVIIQGGKLPHIGKDAFENAGNRWRKKENKIEGPRINCSGKPMETREPEGEER